MSIDDLAIADCLLIRRREPYHWFTHSLVSRELVVPPIEE